MMDDSRNNTTYIYVVRPAYLNSKYPDLKAYIYVRNNSRNIYTWYGLGDTI